MIRTASAHRPFPAGRALALLLCALVAGAALAQAPADATFSGFEPTGEFDFELAGKDLENAEVFYSQRAASYLIKAPELSSPVLIIPSAQEVQTVSLMQVTTRENGNVDILADAEFRPVGRFGIEGQSVVFELKGETAKLKVKPPLLGNQGPEALKSYKPEYGRKADEYRPSPEHLRALASQPRDVRVRVYFGTWCPVCGRQVPKIIKVAEEIESSKVRFEYYGLPQPMTDDKITKQEDLHGVPTVVVYVDGKEIGRLTGHDLNVPEAALSRLLRS